MRPIDADALIKKHPEICSRDMKFNLDLAPTIDAVPVVRCLECKRYDADWFFCDRLEINTDHDFFCAYGEQAGEPKDDSC